MHAAIELWIIGRIQTQVIGNIGSLPSTEDMRFEGRASLDLDKNFYRDCAMH